MATKLTPDEIAYQEVVSAIPRLRAGLREAQADLAEYLKSPAPRRDIIQELGRRVEGNVRSLETAERFMAENATTVAESPPATGPDFSGAGEMVADAEVDIGPVALNADVTTDQRPPGALPPMGAPPPPAAAPPANVMAQAGLREPLPPVTDPTMADIPYTAPGPAAVAPPPQEIPPVRSAPYYGETEGLVLTEPLPPEPGQAAAAGLDLSEFGEMVKPPDLQITEEVIGKTPEGRNIYRNNRGGGSSEYSITERDPRDPKRFINIPSIYSGKLFSPEQALEIIKEAEYYDPETGRKIESYGTLKEAVAAAKARSAALDPKPKRDLAAALPPVTNPQQAAIPPLSPPPPRVEPVLPPGTTEGLVITEDLPPKGSAAAATLEREKWDRVTAGDKPAAQQSDVDRAKWEQITAGDTPAQGYVKSFSHAVGQGALETTATMLERSARERKAAQQVGKQYGKQAGLVPAMTDKQYQALQKRLKDSPLPADTKRTMSSIFRRVREGLLKPEEIPGFLINFERNLPKEAQDWLTKTAKTMFPIPKAHEKKWLIGQGARAIGSSMPFFVSRLLPGGQLMLPIVSAELGMGEAYQRAAQKGATDEEQAKAGMLGALPGITDMAPVELLFQSAPVAPGVKGALYAIATMALKGSAAEGMQEALQNFMQNAIARYVYADKQGYFDGVAEGGLVGAFVGLLFGGLAGSAQVARSGGGPDAGPSTPVPEMQPGPEPVEGGPRALPAPPAQPQIEGPSPTAPRLPPSDTTYGDGFTARSTAPIAPHKDILPPAEPRPALPPPDRVYGDGFVTGPEGTDLEPSRVYSRPEDEEPAPPIELPDFSDQGELQTPDAAGPQPPAEPGQQPSADGDQPPVAATTTEDVDAAAAEADPAPTDAQKDAGNYKKGHVNFKGMDIAIENARGSTRSGKGADGKEWSVEMQAHYGYIKRTKGGDGEQVDVYLAQDDASDTVYVVDQIDPKTGDFDEHKAIIGTASQKEAEALYDVHFNDKSGPKRRGAVTPMSIADFQEWVNSRAAKKPVAYFKEEPIPDEPTAAEEETPSPPPVAEPEDQSKPDQEPPTTETPDAEDTLVIETGAVLRTQTGRETSPAPTVDTTTERKTLNTLKRIDEWLISEATKEAEQQIEQGTLGRHVVPGLTRMTPANLSQSDRDTLNEILFGKPTADRRDVVRVEGKEEPQTPEAKEIVAKDGATIIKPKKPRRRGPMNVLQFIANQGGVRDDGGELAGMNAEKKFLPGFGKFVRSGGKSADEIGEDLHQAGYFGPPDTSNRPTEADVKDLIAEGMRGNHTYSFEDTEALVERDRRKAVADAKKELRQVLNDIGDIEIDTETADEILARLEAGEDPDDVVAGILERQAIQLEQEIEEDAATAESEEAPPFGDEEGREPEPPEARAETGEPVDEAGEPDETPERPAVEPAPDQPKPKPLYANRPVTNAQDIIDWATEQGFKTTLPAEDMHVTVAFSREPVDWGAVGPTVEQAGSAPGGTRSVEKLGDEGAVVLRFENEALQKRWRQYRNAGASWDFEGYKPHVTITYDAGNVDLSNVEPYRGLILLGPEVQENLDTDAVSKVKEAPPPSTEETDQGTQKDPGSDGGLFDTGARAQADIFDQPSPPKETVKLSEETDSVEKQDIPDLTPPPAFEPGMPRIGRLVESHGDVEIRVNPNGSFSVGSMRTGAWASQNTVDDFEAARTMAKEFQERALAYEIAAQQPAASLPPPDMSRVRPFGEHPARGYYYISTGQEVGARYTLRHVGERNGRDNYIGILGKDFEESVSRAQQKIPGDQPIYATEFELNEDRKGIATGKFTFGKHKGKELQDIIDNDPGYIQWMLGNDSLRAKHKKLFEQIDAAGITLEETEDAPADTLPTEEMPEGNERTLAEQGIRVVHSTTPTGKDVWNVLGIPKGPIGDYIMANKKKLGASWYRRDKNWSFWNGDPTEVITALVEGRDPEDANRRLAAQDAGAGADPLKDDERRERREREDTRADERPVIGDAIETVGETTKQLIRRGIEFNVPADIVAEQIEDIALAKAAYEQKRPMFLLANAAGTGKTFVLGGLAREIKAVDAPKIIYVTQSVDLIEQIKKDLADYDIGDVEFGTYASIGDVHALGVDDAVVLFDEAHNVKNVDSQRGKVAREIMAAARFTVVASATPYENPVQAEYLEPTGIYDSVGGFKEWAKMYGAAVRTYKQYTPQGYETVEVVYWVGGKSKQPDAAAARAWLVKQGMMTQRAMKIDASMVDVTGRRLVVSDENLDIYNQVSAAYEAAVGAWLDENGNSRDSLITAQISMHRENTLKRILEAAKVDAAIERAREVLEDGKNIVIFVETKSDRNIGKFRRSAHFKDNTLYSFPEMQEMMDEWKRQADMAAAMHERAPPRPFADFIYEIARHFHEANIDFELPSTASEIAAALKEHGVGIYTGAVTQKKASQAKADFLAGKLKVLLATMAKGGTGLSLHDTVGNRPTVQLNLNLPWSATKVDQVAARVARYGLQSKALVEWLFADNIAWESRNLMPRVAGRMRDMGAVVKGMNVEMADVLDSEFDFEGVVNLKGLTEIEGASEAEAALDDIYELARRLENTRRKADDTSGGFFATPFPIAALMTKISGVKAGDRVLEPSAGTGNLVRFVPDDARVDMVEQRSDNFAEVEKLANRKDGWQAHHGDFLEWASRTDGDYTGAYDVVLMNPPFERVKGIGPQDIAHVRKAYDLLTPNGRLVAIMGEGAFFREQKPDKAFREWLEDIGATVVKLPADAFKKSGTGVQARMVVIDKATQDGSRLDLDMESVETSDLRGIEMSVPSREAASDSSERLSLQDAGGGPAILYSALTRAVEGFKQPKAPAKQWQAVIRKAPGVKAEEIAWTGVNEWLDEQKGSVSKEDLLAFVRENEVQVEEVVKGGSNRAMTDDERNQLRDLIRYQENGGVLTDAQRDEYTRLDAIDRADIDQDQKTATKFSTWVLAGGENYRELLLTLPVRRIPEATSATQGWTTREIDTGWDVYDADGRWLGKVLRGREAETAAGAINHVHDRASRISGFEGGASRAPDTNFTGGHFDEPNVLAHIRFDEREVDGKKVLFIEEIQSDWHQKGRKSGYRAIDLDAKKDEAAQILYGGTYAEGTTEQRRAIDGLANAPDNNLTVPDAPFKSTWHELAMKRVLRYAAENGFDKVAWTTGEQQVTRYESALRKAVDEIHWEKTPEGIHLQGYKREIMDEETARARHLGRAIELAEQAGETWAQLGANERTQYILQAARDYPGKKVVDTTESESTLSDAIGKAMGEQIISSPEQSGVIKGDDIRIDDTGMAGFYDRMLPRFVNKYGKKWGAKAGTVELKTGEESIFDGDQDAGILRTVGLSTETKATTETVHALPITDAMKESVLQGQPMFAQGGQVQPARGTYQATFTDEFNDKRAVFYRLLRKRLDELGLKNVTLEVPDSIGLPGREGAAAGRFVGGGDPLIQVALDNQYGPAKTLNHEAIHALKEAGAFTAKEWSALEAAANSKWRKQYKTDMRYMNFGREIWIEEAVADAFADYAAGNMQATGVIARAFEKIKQIIEAIRSALRGQGFTTPESVFRAVERGEVGARQDTSDQSAADLVERFAWRTPDEQHRQNTENAENALNFQDRLWETLSKPLSWYDPLGNMPGQNAYLAARYKTLGRISAIERVAKDIDHVFSKAEPTVQRQVYDYLTTRGANPSMVTDGAVRAEAVRVKSLINGIGDRLVAAGLLSEEAREAHEDEYLPRVYLKYLLDKDSFGAIGGRPKASDMSYLKARKDIPEDVRMLILGEITDPGYLASIGVGKPARDLAIMDFLEQISQHEEWIFPGTLVEFDGRRVTAHYLKSEADRIRKALPHYEPGLRAAAAAKAQEMEEVALPVIDAAPADPSMFEQVPTTRRYGSLQGMFVRREIYNDVVGSISGGTNDGSTAAWIWSKLTRLNSFWKLSKVALNPPSQIRNFVSNGSLLHLSGVSLQDVPLRLTEAIMDIRSNGPAWKIAKQYGVTQTTFAQQELARIETRLLRIKDRDHPLAWVKQAAAAVANGASDVYGFSEAIFKTAKIIDAMEKGADAETAAIDAHKWLFDYSLVPPLVRTLRSVPVGAPFLCVDEETEILTQRGWLSSDEVKKGDMAASFNMETRHLEWQPVLDLYQKDYGGKDLIYIKDRHLDMAMTPDHRCVTYRRRRVPGMRADDVTFPSLEIVRAHSLNSRDHIPTAAVFEHKQSGEAVSDAIVRVIGWYVTEGSEHPKCQQIIISQNEGPKSDEIREALSVAGFSYNVQQRKSKTGTYSDHNDNVLNYFYVHAKWGKKIRALAPSKALTPEFLMRLSREQVGILVDVMIAGDGHVSKSNGRRCFIQNEGETLDTFQMALSILGLSYNVCEHPPNAKVVTIRDGKNYCIKRATNERRPYHGRIWCPMIAKNGTWLARRNGKPFITHNTWLYKSTPRLLETAVKRPTKFLPYYLIPAVFMWMISEDYDVTFDDLEKLKQALPKWLREKGNAFILPYKDSEGRWQYVDLGYHFPWGAQYEIASNLAKGDVVKAVDAVGVGGAPLLQTITAIQTNIDPFTKRKIVDPADPPARQLAAIMGYAWRMAAPTWLTDFGAVNKSLQSFGVDYELPGIPIRIGGTGEGYRGEPGATVPQALGRFVGVNIYPIDPDQTRAANVRGMQFEINEIKRRHRSEIKNQRLSPSQREAANERFRDHLMNRYKQLREYVEKSDVHPNLR